MRSHQGTTRVYKRFGAVAVAALMAASCASVDQELLQAQLPETPAAWSAAPDATAPLTGDWVAAFHDSSLYDLIGEALAHNNNFLAAAANLKASRASAAMARAGLLPTLGANFSASRNAVVTNYTTAVEAGGSSGGGGSTRSYINNYSLGGQLSWEIDMWGRLTDETKAAYRQARASYADFAGARLSIAAGVAQSWFTLIEARQLRELSERNVTAQESSLRVTERRYERGVASSLDVRLARSALASSQASLAQQKRAELEASRSLEVLLGRYPAAELEAAESLPELPPLAGVGAPGDLLARRPDILAAEARMDAAGLTARAARKELLPQFTLASRVGTSGTVLADLTDPNRLAGNLVGGIFQPLFQGGRLLANAKRARASAESAVYNYVETVLTAYKEAENALAAEDLLAEREKALKLAFEEADAAEKLTQRRYSSGAATIFNLLDAQTRRISAESSYIQAQQQRVSNRVELYLAIGGDFLTEAELAATQTGESE